MGTTVRLPSPKVFFHVGEAPLGWCSWLSSTPAFIHSSKRIRSDLILLLSSEGDWLYFPNYAPWSWVPQPTHGLCGIFSGEAQRHLDTQLTTLSFRPYFIDRTVWYFFWPRGTVKNILRHPGPGAGQFGNSVLTPHLPFFCGAALWAEKWNSSLILPQRGDGGVLHHLSLGGLSNSQVQYWEACLPTDVSHALQ